MPSKKKKYNARFPAGRIKKIMQSDEEVGKVAQAVPIIISRTLELFVESMLTKTLRITNARNAKTLTPSHMKQCIMSESRFDFLRELVKNIPDINVAEDMEDAQSSPLPQTEPLCLINPSIITTTTAPTTIITDLIPSHTATKRSHDTDAGSSSTQWKLNKQHSLDSITNKAPNFYTQTSTTAETDALINYSIKIKMDDKAITTPKLTRMESTPASFGTNNNLASSPAIQSTNFLPVSATTKLTSSTSSTSSSSSSSALFTANDKLPPILNFDFTQIPLTPLAASTSQSATSSTNHSHSVANILKNDNKTKSTNIFNSPKNEIPSLPAKITQSSIKANLQTSQSSPPPPPIVTPNSSSLTSAMQSHSIAPLMSYSIPSAGTNSLEMDEDYDNI